MNTGSPAFRRVLRCALLSSVMPFAAHAQDRPFASIEAPHAAETTLVGPAVSVAPSGLAPGSSIDEPQIVINPPGTPTTARDTKDITGVGQMFINNGGGSLSLCTGTLVNPRMVIFAAHCVNTSAASAYGTETGNRQIAFGFKADNLQGVRDWLFGNATTGVTAFRSTPANALFNVNQISYLTDSLKTENRGFLQSDVAVASLDTPAVGIPAWALLFSALPAPSAINASTGTGYHVTITGYGRNGTGLNGDSGGIDYRRRVAENYLGALASLSDVDDFLYGSSERSLNQNLYMTDLDDPRRGTASASPFDFNLFRDNALLGEGTTAGGDSGGPLILDRTYSKPVVLGVLSGGSRYYTAQPSSSYGTTSFYQPLYLYWDYIVSANPYRYVSAKPGDAKWSDASHWQTDLDPNYQISANGNLINGVPTTAGLGEAGAGGDFGQLCFDTPTSSECQDLATGNYTYNGAGIGNVGVDTNPVAAALPAATLANGLPGATGFAPDNSDPNKAAGVVARYFDVTLAAAGTTTLDTSVTIDRLSIATGNAKLNVTSAGSLTSLIEINQLNGQTIVDGRIRSGGDYFLLGGLLSGSGRIDTPYLTSVTGTIAPGTLGGTGTLTVGGNLVLASGTQLVMDIGNSGASDRIAVIGTTTTDGMANVGGSIQFVPVAGSTIRYNDSYTLLTAERGVTGSFATPGALSAILRPVLSYGATGITARIDAGSYAGVVAGTPIQRAYAQLLDQNRGNYAALSTTYGILDLQNQATIQSSLEGLAPRTETTRRALGTVALDNMARFYRERLAAIDPVQPLGGSLAVIGGPNAVVMGAVAMPDMATAQVDTAGTTIREGVLPDDTSAFLAGGYIRGSSPSMPTALPMGGRDQFDGYYIAGGVEKALSDTAVLGFGLSYSDVDADAQVGQAADGTLIQGTLYAKAQAAMGATVDAQFGAGVYQARTTRSVALAATPFTLKSRDNALALSAEVGASYLFGTDALHIGPRIAVRASSLGFTPTSETGGGPALRYDADNYVSLQGRAGAVLDGSFGGLRPFASAYYVREFEDRAAFFTANFAGGVGSSVAFALPSRDDEWGEIGGGFAFGSDRIELSLAADTTIARDIRNQSYRGTVKVRF
jgi:uncharacterized protein YhjY with autotransporter beta-barrel domain